MRAMGFIVSIFLVAFFATGCATSDRGTDNDGLRLRNPAEARRQILRGNDAVLRGDLATAERAYRAALAADAFSGVAHNNLGRVYYQRHKLYAAAQHFDRAARLMPHQLEPRNNLGLVFEAAGKLDDAIAAYDRALKRQPDRTELLANLARARVRRGDADESLRLLLMRVAAEDDRPGWREWAVLTAIKVDRYAADDQKPPQPATDDGSQTLE